MKGVSLVMAGLGLAWPGHPRGADATSLLTQKSTRKSLRLADGGVLVDGRAKPGHDGFGLGTVAIKWSRRRQETSVFRRAYGDATI